MTKYYGKYRGLVVVNEDPERRGRILVQVPDVTGLVPGTWAMPCVPFAGIQNGMWCVPQIGAGVWVEFEQGNPDYPIWTGGFWSTAADVPALAQTALPTFPNIVLQTIQQSGITISDNPGIGIMIKTSLGAMITINATGILLSNGQGATILMSGPSVTVNAGALMVT
jgi:uncharacterized protein involved in type VI secretion and phage assembly